MIAHLVNVEADPKANFGETTLVELIKKVDQCHAKGLRH